ncbi:MAG: BTAD domain-containing putative transcriptional regulator [Actinomycetes bacterium]
MEYRILGPLEVVDGDRTIALGGPKQRAVLAMLLLDVGRVVSVDRLIQGVWGDEAADGAMSTLQVYVSNLRKVLEPVKGEHTVLIGRRPGYVLEVEPDSVDALRFDRLLGEARKDLANERYDSASRLFAQALGTWRGQPLADVPLDEFAAPEITRLTEARIAALEDQVDAELGCGRHVAMVSELGLLVDEYPYRERLWGQLIVALYRSGLQADALSAYTRARDLLIDEYGIDPGPELRDLERRVLSQDPGLAAPPGSARSSVKLPALPNPVIGREDEIAVITARLNDPSTRALTLTGPGGAGKTSLSLEVAARTIDDYPGGVFFVPLADIEEADQVLPAIAAVLEVSESVDEPLLSSVVLSLGSGRTLVVLDNFEQILAAGPRVAELLRQAPQLKLLISSRARLRIRGESEHPVAPLDASSALTLFVDRMSDGDPALALDEAGRTTVAKICEQLDGLPLAIELAAARGRLLGPEALLERLGGQLALLTTGASDLPDRQRTLRAAIDWSHTLLDAAQQELFARLGAITGEFTLEAAQAVAGTGQSDIDVIDGLAALVDNSMVRRLTRADGPRFRLLDTMREYAAEQLARSEDEAAIREALTEHLLAVLESTEADFDGPEAPRLLARVDSDYPNLRAALGWALDHGRPDLAARLAVGLRPHWFAQGRLSEGREWLGRVLAADELVGDLRARAALAGGIFAYLQDDPDEAKKHLTEALELSRTASDDATTASALAYLGALVLGSGAPQAALGMASEALRIARSAGLYEARALALSLSAVVAATNDELDTERTLYAERLALVRKHGDRRRIAETLNNLAEVALADGSVDQARAFAGEALELARNVAKMVTRDVLVSLGRVAVADGGAAQAVSYAHEALQLSVELGQQFEISQCLLVLAGVASLEGDDVRAAKLYGCASRLRDETSPLDVELEPDIAVQRQRTRGVLGDDRFLAVHAGGATMSRDEAIGFALESR